jgi:hypothetical protein
MRSRTSASRDRGEDCVEFLDSRTNVGVSAEAGQALRPQEAESLRNRYQVPWDASAQSTFSRKRQTRSAIHTHFRSRTFGQSCSADARLRRIALRRECTIPHRPELTL